MNTPKAVTFPIRVTDEYMREVGEAADREGKSKHDFILEAINEKVAKGKETQK